MLYIYSVGEITLQQRIARIENAFIENAQYDLSVREQKIVLLLISKIDPYQETLVRQNVPLKELENSLVEDGKKQGAIYDYFETIADTLGRRGITFETGIEYRGKTLPGRINWFSHVMPNVNEYGEKCIEFEFAPILKNFLLKLKEYVQIDRLEVSKMKHRYSIRLHQLLSTALGKQQNHRHIVTKKYAYQYLRDILGLNPKEKGEKVKYPEFKAFNQFVLSKAIKEINECSSLNVERKFIRASNRRVTEIEFTISRGAFDPNQKVLDFGQPNAELTKAEKHKKRLQFDLEKFKKKYPKIYREKALEIQEFFKKHKKKGGKSMPQDRMITMINNACETWFIEHG